MSSLHIKFLLCWPVEATVLPVRTVFSPYSPGHVMKKKFLSVTKDSFSVALSMHIGEVRLIRHTLQFGPVGEFVHAVVHP